RQPMRLVVAGKASLMPPHDLAGFHRRPQIALTVFQQTGEPVAGQPRTVALVEDGEAYAVKAHQPVKGRKPQIAIARLYNAAHGVLRQPVVRRPVIKAVLRESSSGAKEAKQEALARCRAKDCVIAWGYSQGNNELGEHCQTSCDSFNRRA